MKYSFRFIFSLFIALPMTNGSNLIKIGYPFCKTVSRTFPLREVIKDNEKLTSSRENGFLVKVGGIIGKNRIRFKWESNT